MGFLPRLSPCEAPPCRLSGSCVPRRSALHQLAWRSARLCFGRMMRLRSRLGLIWTTIFIDILPTRDNQVGKGLA